MNDPWTKYYFSVISYPICIQPKGTRDQVSIVAVDGLVLKQAIGNHNAEQHLIKHLVISSCLKVNDSPIFTTCQPKSGMQKSYGVAYVNAKSWSVNAVIIQHL